MRKKKILRKLTLLAIMSFGLVGCGKKIEKRDKKKAPKDTRPALKSQVEETEDISAEVKINKELLLSAISANDVNLVKSALKENTKIEYLFENGESPLTFAIKFAKAQVISMIIDKSQDLNFSNKAKQSPLQLVVRFDKFLALNKLIKKGVDLDQQDLKSRPALFYALEDEKERHFILLVRNGANFNIPMEDADVSLIRKLQELQFIKAIKLVRQINKHLTIHESYLIKAIKEYDLDFLNYLLINFPYYQNFIKENNVLAHAIEYEETYKANTLTDILLTWGANPNITTPEPPIITAIKMRRNNIVGSLTSYNADITLEDENGLNLLDYAVTNLNTKIIEELFIPIKASLDELSEEERIKYSDLFTKACDHIPTEQAEGMTWRKFIQGKKKVSQILNCQGN